MNTQRLTIKSQELISAMQALAGDHGHQEIRDLHLLAAMLAQPEALIHPLLAKLEIPETELAAALSQALNRLPRVSGAQAYAAQEILDILHAAERKLTAWVMITSAASTSCWASWIKARKRPKL